MLLRVHANECRHQSSQGVGHARQEQLVHDPDVVFRVEDGESEHADGGDATHYGSDDEERNVLDALYEELGGLV